MKKNKIDPRLQGVSEMIKELKIEGVRQFIRFVLLLYKIASKEEKMEVLDLLYIEVPEYIKDEIEAHFGAIYVLGDGS